MKENSNFFQNFENKLLTIQIHKDTLSRVTVVATATIFVFTSMLTHVRIFHRSFCFFNTFYHLFLFWNTVGYVLSGHLLSGHFAKSRFFCY